MFLTDMLRAGEVNRKRAEEIVTMVMRAKPTSFTGCLN
jgi:hypothetical protein